MALELKIEANAYVLSDVHQNPRAQLAILQGGAQSLLPDQGVPSEAALEAAIQIAEDWVMPPLKPAHDPVLGVVDTTGRLAAGRQAVLSSTANGWTLEEIEQDFQKVVAQATGRNPPVQLATHRAFVADLLLLRELAHHGAFASMRVVGKEI